MVTSNTELAYNSKIEGEVIVSRADAVINWIRPGLLRDRADGGGREPF